MRKILNTIPLLTLCLLLICPISAWAKPQIVVNMSSAMEVSEIVDGREVKKMVPSEIAEPGQTLQFTLNYANKGDEKAQRVVINNPIPKDAVYLVGSATGEGSEIQFSIDGGKTFKKPSMLTYELKEPDGSVVRKQASPEQYTNIRWIITEIPPGSQGEVSFKVRVK